MATQQPTLESVTRKLDTIEQLLALALRDNAQGANSGYLTINEAADLICKSIHTVYGLVSRREIPHRKNGNRLLFIEEELRSWLEEGKR